MKILIYIFLLFQVFRVESIPIFSELLRQIRAENISSNDAKIVWESYDTSTILLLLLLQAPRMENITYSDIKPVDGFEISAENITYSDIKQTHNASVDGFETF